MTRKRTIEKIAEDNRRIRFIFYAIFIIAAILPFLNLLSDTESQIKQTKLIQLADYNIIWLPVDSEYIRRNLRYIKKKYGKIIQREADKHQVSIDDIVVIIHIESNGNKDAVSSVGAIGLMQVKRGTARDMGIKYPKNPKYNISAGAEYYSKMLLRFGSQEYALAAYNMGPYKLKKEKRKNFKESEYFYVKKFQDAKNVLKYTM